LTEKIFRPVELVHNRIQPPAFEMPRYGEEQNGLASFDADMRRFSPSFPMSQATPESANKL
jgi:hypothetical protein